MADDLESYYAYKPSHALPSVFAALVGISLLLHIYQSFRYHYWRVMFFMCWGGLAFTAGWIMRVLSSYHVANKNLYIAQYVLILCGPPIFAAAEYNVLGRLLQYLPMHSPIHPRRIMYFFIYLGALVEALTAAGGARMSVAGDDRDKLRSGAVLVTVASCIQIAIEFMFMFMVIMLNRRVSRAKMLTPDVRKICIMLYGTSTLILVRSIYRAIEKISIMNVVGSEACDGTCATVLRHEWLLYVFEAAPMVVYTWWINAVHPGRYLPSKTTVYLGFDKVERSGPGWIDKIPKWRTFVDPFDWIGLFTREASYEKYWEKPEDFPVVRKTGKANGREVVLDGAQAKAGGANV